MTSYKTGEWRCAGVAVRNQMTVKLPSLSINEGVARATVAAFCVQAGPGATELADIKCAVSEAVTNCIVHAYRGSVGEVILKVQILEDDRIAIEIRDRGCGIPDVKQAREPLYTTDAEGERSGMGFTVMESFCDGVRVRSAPGKGTSVVLIKRLQPHVCTT